MNYQNDFNKISNAAKEWRIGNSLDCCREWCNNYATISNVFGRKCCRGVPFIPPRQH